MTQTLFRDFTPGELWALAQMLKRLSWDDLKRLAASENELFEMRDGTIRLLKLLAELGYDPR